MKILRSLPEIISTTVEPGAVESLEAAPLSPGSLEVRWRPPTEESSAQVTGYTVRYREMVISDCVVEHAAWSHKLSLDANTYR